MIYLISEKEIKTTILNENIDSNYLREAIMLAQEQDLEPILGSYLFRTICNLVENNAIKSEEYTDYKVLLDKYISTYLLYQVVSEIIVPIQFKIGNLGVATNSDTNLQSASKSQVEYLMQYYSDKAAVAADRLSRYLHANHNLFPEFYKKEKCNDLLPREESAYRCSINI